MQRTQIYLQRTQKVKLHKLAKERNMTISEVIRNFINKGISPAQKKKKRDGFSLVQAAKHFEILAEKGPRDLSEKIDMYLYGKK